MAEDACQEDEAWNKSFAQLRLELASSVCWNESRASALLSSVCLIWNESWASALLLPPRLSPPIMRRADERHACGGADERHACGGELGQTSVMTESLCAGPRALPAELGTPAARSA